ncbi:hypothetical protein RvY_17449 [Ramazzottius varieornatus]|uniref:Protein giant-lens n=1 Tax=Ramazzottius varieornatus TaxID=947166 RepID=A0A1D1W803_RAMVA|nr:hypothetical protein RvY_17449 [Ramazzottius varieornatus]
MRTFVDLEVSTFLLSILLFLEELTITSSRSPLSPIQYLSTLEKGPLYNDGEGEADLPSCSKHSICNRIEDYSGNARVHRLCRCPNHPRTSSASECSQRLDASDGTTIVDDTQLLKTCGPTASLPVCRFFHDTAYTITSYPAQNRTSQVVRCRCPAHSHMYLLKWTQKHAAPNHKITYHHACSPPTFLKCGAEEPCSLFVVTGTNIHKQSVCSCSTGLTCPTRLNDPSVTEMTVDVNHNATTYAAFCHKPHLST